MQPINSRKVEGLALEVEIQTDLAHSEDLPERIVMASSSDPLQVEMNLSLSQRAFAGPTCTQGRRCKNLVITSGKD